MILSDFWEEKTIIRFVLNVDGEITESYFIYKPLVNKVIGNREDSSTRFYDLEGEAPTSGRPPRPQQNFTDQE